MGKLTNKELEALQPSDKGKRLREDGGLLGVVRVRGDGISVKWDWRYRFERKVRQVSLGSWPKETMPGIRAERKRLGDILSDGRDPAEAKYADKLAANAYQAETIARTLTRIAEVEVMKARITVKDLFERWEHLELSGRKDKGAEVRRSFKKDVIPALGEIAAEDIRRTHIAGVLDRVVSRGARIAARNLLGDIRQMYGFAIARGLLEADPTSHMKRDDYGRKVERERVLSEAEIKALAIALPGAHLPKSAELVIWIQLSTCCRIGELLQARWADVDRQGRTWRIPAHVAKNSHEHTVHLSDFALEQFEALYKLTGTKVKDDEATGPGMWVMPARESDEHVDLKSLTKQISDRQRGDKKALPNRSKHRNALVLQGGKWTCHDLRRTGATMMVGLGVLPEVVERCLNHREQNRVKRIYQRHDYKREMQDAWHLLGERVRLLIGGAENVMVLPQRRAA